MGAIKLKRLSWEKKRTAAKINASLCARMKSWRLLRNSNQQSGCIGEIRAICGLMIFPFPPKIVLTPVREARKIGPAPSRLGVSSKRAPP